MLKIIEKNVCLSWLWQKEDAVSSHALQLWEFNRLILNLLLGFGTLHDHKLDVWHRWWRIVGVPTCKVHKGGQSQNQECMKDQPRRSAPVSDQGLDWNSNILQSSALDVNLCMVSESPQTGMHLSLKVLLGSVADPDCLKNWIWRDRKLQK